MFFVVVGGYLHSALAWRLLIGIPATLKRTNSNMYTAYKYARRKYRQHKQNSLHPIELQSQADSRPNSASTPLTKHEETAEEKAEKKRRRRYRYKIVFGLFFPYALQALDMTIVASALPYIAEDFSMFVFLYFPVSILQFVVRRFCRSFSFPLAFHHHFHFFVVFSCLPSRTALSC